MGTFVYTFSSIEPMPQQAFISIQTLKQQITDPSIIVFYTPPRNPLHQSWFDSLNIDLRLVDNKTSAFAAFEDPQHYGEKTRIGEVSDDTVVFLDCDTLVLGDISEVLAGDFEFKARPGTESSAESDWEELFDRFDRPYLDWWPNAGFMVFKHGTHRKLADDWRSLLNEDLGYQHKDVNHKEQYALSLAVSGYDIEQMTPTEHVMMWADEMPPDGIVYHIGNTFRRGIETAPQSFKGNLYVGLRQLMKGNI